MTHGILFVGDDWADFVAEDAGGQIVLGIEPDRGPLVTALSAASCQVFAINPLSSAR